MQAFRVPILCVPCPKYPFIHTTHHLTRVTRLINLVKQVHIHSYTRNTSHLARVTHLTTHRNNGGSVHMPSISTHKHIRIRVSLQSFPVLLRIVPFLIYLRRLLLLYLFPVLGCIYISGIKYVNYARH